MYDHITQLARDLDEFAYNYDHYGYVDAIEDRDQAREELKQDLIDGKCVRVIIDHLTEIANEHDIEWEPRARKLIDRVRALDNLQ